MAKTAALSMDLTADKHLTVNLPDPTLVRGRLKRASGESLQAGSRVRLFLNVDNSSWSIDGTNFAGELLKVADVLTTEDGRFEAVVPLLKVEEPQDQDGLGAGSPMEDDGAWDEPESESAESLPLPPFEEN